MVGTFFWLRPVFLFYAFICWLLPFIFSCFFFDRQGQLQVGMAQFKTYMFGVCSVFGAFCFDRILSGVLRAEWVSSTPESFTATAVEFGVFMVAVSSALDILILIPLVNATNRQRPQQQLTVYRWFHDIGFGYLAIGAQAWLAGRFADHALEVCRQSSG